MKITLDLGTLEKQSFFLALFDDPCGAVDYLEKVVKSELRGSQPPFHAVLSKLTYEQLLDLSESVFTEATWMGVREQLELQQNNTDE